MNPFEELHFDMFQLVHLSSNQEIVIIFLWSESVVILCLLISKRTRVEFFIDSDTRESYVEM